MAGIRVEGNTSGNVAEVNASNQIKVITETNVTSNPSNVGGMMAFSQNDAGSKTGTPLLVSPMTSSGRRIRSGIDAVIDSDTFNYANQNTGKYRYLSSTMTMAQSSGALVTNAASTTAVSATAFTTWNHIAIAGGQSPTYVEVIGSLSAALATNTTIDFGIFIQSGTSPYTPIDGAYFRFNSSGLFGVVNNNGAEITTSVFAFSPTINQTYQFVIEVAERLVRFWVDGVLYATLLAPTASGQAFLSPSFPFQIRHAIITSVAGSALSFRVFDYSIIQGDVAASYPYEVSQARAGASAQVQQGATTGGQLSTYAVGAAPAAVTLAANTAPATSSLGGLFLLPAVVTAGESDYPLFAWLNPVGSATIPGKVFVCTGIIVGESYVTTALTGGPLILTWAIGFGSTAPSLATVESTTFSSGTTKISRKYPIGAQSLSAAAAAGVISSGFSRDFGDAPLAINPGEYLHVIIRALGTSTSAGAIRGSVFPMGYFI